MIPGWELVAVARGAAWRIDPGVERHGRPHFVNEPLDPLLGSR